MKYDESQPDALLFCVLSFIVGCVVVGFLF